MLLMVGRAEVPSGKGAWQDILVIWLQLEWRASRGYLCYIKDKATRGITHWSCLVRSPAMIQGSQWVIGIHRLLWEQLRQWGGSRRILQSSGRLPFNNMQRKNTDKWRGKYLTLLDSILTQGMVDGSTSKRARSDRTLAIWLRKLTLI